MSKYIFYILPLFLIACNLNRKENTNEESDKVKQISATQSNDEIKLSVRFNKFDTIVEVLFQETIDSITEIQKRNFDGFVAKQDSLFADILKTVFEFYKKSYAAYKEGWTMTGKITDDELKKYLPKPTTPDDLKSFITPAIIHIQDKKNCEEGTLGIEFDCTWDIENGLGVLIQKWKVVNAGVAEISYFLK